MSVAAIEASGRAALPALYEERHGDWLLRISGGDTKRVNSANPLADGAHPAEVIAAAEALYESRGLPCRFRLTPLAHRDADAMLADAGYMAIDRSWTMLARLGPRAIDPAVSLHDTTSGIELAAPLAERSDVAQAIHARLIEAVAGPKTIAILCEGGRALATGFASIGDGRVQLADIVVAPDSRGQGLGRRLVAGLLGWAYEAGSREVMLQVLDDNHVARELYRSLGFVDAYGYHYRVRR